MVALLGDGSRSEEPDVGAGCADLDDVPVIDDALARRLIDEELIMHIVRICVGGNPNIRCAIVDENRWTILRNAGTALLLGAEH